MHTFPPKVPQPVTRQGDTVWVGLRAPKPIPPASEIPPERLQLFCLGDFKSVLESDALCWKATTMISSALEVHPSIQRIGPGGLYGKSSWQLPQGHQSGSQRRSLGQIASPVAAAMGLRPEAAVDARENDRLELLTAEEGASSNSATRMGGTWGWKTPLPKALV